MPKTKIKVILATIMTRWLTRRVHQKDQNRLSNWRDLSCKQVSSNICGMATPSRSFQKAFGKAWLVAQIPTHLLTKKAIPLSQRNQNWLVSRWSRECSDSKLNRKQSPSTKSSCTLYPLARHSLQPMVRTNTTLTCRKIQSTTRWWPMTWLMSSSQFSKKERRWELTRCITLASWSKSLLTSKRKNNADSWRQRNSQTKNMLT